MTTILPIFVAILKIYLKLVDDKRRVRPNNKGKKKDNVHVTESVSKLYGFVGCHFISDRKWKGKPFI